MRKELRDALVEIKYECMSRDTCYGCPMEIGNGRVRMFRCLFRNTQMAPEDWNIDKLEELSAGHKSDL